MARPSNARITVKKKSRCLIVGCKETPQSFSFFAGYFLCENHRLRVTTKAFIECLDKLSQSKSLYRYESFVRNIRKIILPERGKQCSTCTDIKSIKEFNLDSNDNCLECVSNQKVKSAIKFSFNNQSKSFEANLN